MTGEQSKEIPADWLAEFEADDAHFRAFDSTAEYHRWCEQNLPDWLGYGSF